MTISTGIALASLALSVYLYVRQRWERREASVSARLQSSSEDHGLMLVLVNNGPHWADGLTAEVQLRGGGEARGVFQISEATEVRDLPIPRLHAGESYYLRGFYKVLGAEPAQVALRWRDGRYKAVERVVQLSVHPD